MAITTSCDKIEGPYTEINGGGGTGGGNDSTEVVVRKILLEEFTGHNCVNCPGGASKAKQLQEIYGERLIVLSVHAGFFAMPTGGSFTADYRTGAGTEWNSFFGFQAYPSGMINRTQNNGSYPLGKDEWAEVISNTINEEPAADINIETEYSSSDRELNIDLNSKFLLEQEGEFYLQVCLLEDSIVSPQKNSEEAFGDVPVIENYVHRHVLRDAVNGSWGELLTNTVNVGEELSKSYSLTLDESYNSEHCAIIAFIYNKLDYSIIQVEEKHIE